MSKTEWYRRATWTAADREDFNLRLKRSRPWNKAQYLRIQAGHLAELGLHEDAIELLDRMLTESSERFGKPCAHLQRANSLGILNRVLPAIDEYRLALQAERDFPNVKTLAWLDFGWFVVERQLADLYDEALQVLAEFRDEEHLKLPVIEYRYWGILALVADACGDEFQARAFAARALAEAAKEHSGLRYHPYVGLVGPECSTVEDRLKALTGSC